jgi:hypothetical protein
MTLLQSTSGKKIISIILGLGLASLFRKVCNENRCIIVKGPDLSTISKRMYRIDDKCYTYEPHPTLCAQI